MNLTGQPPQPKRPKPSKDPARLARIRDLPCCICHEWWLPQYSPTQAHHCIMGRHGQRKTPDSMAIPLCEGHHLGQLDTSKVALHQDPDLWRKTYGLDTDWISWTDERIGR